ncbi:hypothetical protein NW765_011676 [Fusarium oxysporum]|nr:hypothetical protein NW765_011676 [Fusarium oxysporum]KAJ4272609.1 hypothetical protein NW764_013228 [Fusarium oxysporum]
MACLANAVGRAGTWEQSQTTASMLSMASGLEPTADKDPSPANAVPVTVGVYPYDTAASLEHVFQYTPFDVALEFELVCKGSNNDSSQEFTDSLLEFYMTSRLDKVQ